MLCPQSELSFESSGVMLSSAPTTGTSSGLRIVETQSVLDVSEDVNVVGDVRLDEGGVGKAARTVSKSPPRIDSVPMLEIVSDLE